MSAADPTGFSPVLDETESGYDERGVFADAMDEWTGRKRKPSHYRDWRCSKQGLLSKHNVETITNVTFLSAGEIKNIEQVFQFIAKHVKQNEDKPKDESDGALSYVYRRVAAPPKPGAQGDDDQDTQRDEGELVRVVALTAGQLRKYLPEFNLNVFFDRLVRVFSESGEQMLTLVELIDLYSALSHRASVKWKARVCFCVFDFDEDNKLGRRDIIRTVGRMVQDTHMSSSHSLKQEEAASSIQRLYRGFRARRAGHAKEKKRKKKRKDKDAGEKMAIKDLHAGLNEDKGTTKLDSYALKMVEECSEHNVQKDVMDYAYFEEVMSCYEPFRDNFCVSMTKIEHLEKQHSDHKQGDESPTWLLGCCMQIAQKLHIGNFEVEEAYDDEKTTNLREDGSSHKDGGSPIDDGGKRSPRSPRSPLGQLWSPLGAAKGDSPLRELAKQVWDVHIGRARLSFIDGTLSLDGAVSAQEAAQMIVQNVPSPEGKLWVEILRPGMVQKALRLGDAQRVQKDQFVRWYEEELPTLPAEEGWLHRQYPEEFLRRYTGRMLLLWDLWPDWIGESEKTPYHPWAEEEAEGDDTPYHLAPRLHHDVCRALYEHMWIAQWRHNRAEAFKEFYEKMMKALEGRGGGGTMFGRWDTEKSGGLSKPELEEALKRELCTKEGDNIDHEVDLLMHILIDMDPHGVGFIHRKDFENFMELDHDKVYRMAADVTEWDLSASRDIDDAASPTGRGDRTRSMVWVWEWGTFEQTFKKWWAQWHTHAAHAEDADNSSEHSISLRNWCEFWFAEDTVAEGGRPATTDLMIEAASKVKWGASMQVAEDLWEKFDRNGSGSALQSDAKRLVGEEIVSEHGHHLQATTALSARERRKGLATYQFNHAITRLRLFGLDLRLKDRQTHLQEHLKALEQNKVDQSQDDLSTLNARDEDDFADWMAGAAQEEDAAKERAKKSMAHTRKALDGIRRMRQDIENQLDMKGPYEPQLQDERRKGETPLDELKRLVLEKEADVDSGQAVLRMARMGGIKKLPENAEIRRTCKNPQSDFVKRARDVGFTDDDLAVAGLHVSAHDNELVKKEAFIRWWRKQRWIVKEYTYKLRKLDKVWLELNGTTGEDGFKVWKARAVLAVIWGVDKECSESLKAREDFHRRLVAWLQEYDRDHSGKISKDQFGVWWVSQPLSLLNKARKHSWSELEMHFDREAMMDEFGAMMAEVERGVESSLSPADKDSQVDGKKLNKREKTLEKMLDDLDKEITDPSVGLNPFGGNWDDTTATGVPQHVVVEGHHDAERNRLWLKMNNEVKLKIHQTAYGVLTGGSRQPLLRTRLRLFSLLKADKHQHDTLKALQRSRHASAFQRFVGLFWHKMLEEAQHEHNLLHTKAKDALNDSGGRDGNRLANETVGEMLGDFFLVHTHRCCCDMYWIHDLRTWTRAVVNTFVLRHLDIYVHDLEMKFGHGVAEILRRAKFMIWLNALLGVLWTGAVIIPRDHSEGGGGLLNTTAAVMSALFMPDDSTSSLFYDGYRRNMTVEIHDIELRIDLLYFLSIIGSVFVSMYAILRTMGMNIDSLAQGVGVRAIGVQQDSESHKCAALLGHYCFSVVSEVDSQRMRQRIRRKLDTWLQSLAAANEERAMAFEGKDATAITRLRRAWYEARIIVGLALTVVTFGLHVLALSFILIHAKNLTIGGYAFDSFIISGLDNAVPYLLKKIVKYERRVRHEDQLKQLTYRVYLCKIIQLVVILYSLGKISTAVEGSVYDRGAGNEGEVVQCREALFGDVFLRLVVTDALLFIVYNYFWLYAVNHGLPRFWLWFNVTAAFKNNADHARYKALCSWHGAKYLGSDEKQRVPGLVVGTDWEIRELSDKSMEDWIAQENHMRQAQAKQQAYGFVQSWTLEKTLKMPQEVKEALNATHNLQKRTFHPPRPTFEQRLRRDHRQGKHTQWWKRKRPEEETAGDDVTISLDQLDVETQRQLPIAWDWTASIEEGGNSCWTKLRGCCSTRAIGPRIKEIYPDEGDDVYNNLTEGMVLHRIDDEDISKWSVRSVIARLESTAQLTLTFKPVVVETLMENWATSVVMQNLTDASIRVEDLGTLSQMLVDAGYRTRRHISKDVALTPDKLEQILRRQRRTGHRCRYLHPDIRHSEPGSHKHVASGDEYATCMYIVHVQPKCSKCKVPMSKGFRQGAHQRCTQCEAARDHDERLPRPASPTLGDAPDAHYMQRSYFMLKDGLLSYVWPKDPAEAFKELQSDDSERSQFEQSDTDGDRVNASKLGLVFAAMHVDLPPDAVGQALKEMAPGGSDTVSLDEFQEWWSSNAKSVLAQQDFTGRIDMQDWATHLAVHQTAGHTRFVIEAADRILTAELTAEEGDVVRNSGSQDAVTRMYRHGNVVDESWQQILEASIPPKQPIWGADIQRQTDTIGQRAKAVESEQALQTKDSFGEKASTGARFQDHNFYRTTFRQLRQLVRQAEQLVVEGHKFAAGGAAAKDAVLHELFQAYDTNNNGALEKGEVRKLLKHLCRPHESEEEVSWEDSADAAKKQLKRHATLKKIAKEELQQCMQEMEGISGGLDRRHRKIDFIAFKKWWQKRLKDRKQAGLAAEYWSAVRSHASHEYAEAVRIYDQITARLKHSLTHLVLHHQEAEGSPKKGSPKKQKQKPGHIQLDHLEQDDDGDAASPKLEEEEEEEEKKMKDRRVELKVMEIADLKREVDDAGAGELGQLLIDEVVLAMQKREIVAGCKQAEEALSTKMANGRKKRRDRPKALLCYERALRRDESNAHLQKRVSHLSESFNRAAKRLSDYQIKDFANQLIKYEGQWEEVTAEVNEQRLWKPRPRKIDGQESANLLTNILFRQAFVWVGSTWCPWLPAVAVLTQVLMYWSLCHGMLGIRWRKIAPHPAYRSTGEEWAASQTKSTFMSLSLATLIVCIVPLLVWLNQEPTCGPHSVTGEEESAAVYETVGVFIRWLETKRIEDGAPHFFGGEISEIAAFLFNPPLLIIVIVYTYTRYRFMAAENTVLKRVLDQSKRHAKEEKKQLTLELTVGVQAQVDRHEKLRNITKEFFKKGREETGSERTHEERLAKAAGTRTLIAKSVGVLSAQVQRNHDATCLDRVHADMDDEVQRMDPTGLFKRSAHVVGALSAAQSRAELTATRADAPVSSETEAPDASRSTEMEKKVLALSSLWIGNIAADFANEKAICERIEKETHPKAVLACTVQRASSAHWDTVRLYPNPSWALVTLRDRATAHQYRSAHGAVPARDADFQPMRGAWHAIPWEQAQRSFAGVELMQGSVSCDTGVEGNSKLVNEHNGKLKKCLKDGDGVFLTTADGGQSGQIDDPKLLDLLVRAQGQAVLEDGSSGQAAAGAATSVANPLWADPTDVADPTGSPTKARAKGKAKKKKKKPKKGGGAPTGTKVTNPLMMDGGALDLDGDGDDDGGGGGGGGGVVGDLE